MEFKKSGVLGWLKTIAEAGEKLTELVASDYKLMRMLALLEALQGGVGRLEPRGLRRGEEERREDD